ncbi:multisubunit Na+/H+ antiporter MrpB [Legionella oakridgensis ATCC 33761 = DSM 21215]|uniref:Multisubunit Na+/H+ antiporter MrpB n=2 Tax=Legionella oakridgensis TaxID=29423 RepID=W0BEX4_9GAMM|nr:MnhB domain-containing protein [Legionella oakridgensis]AHE67236.1 multisubunit Na+/H+ antiporter MrpB [Legionella oakridgensis ATCC 33761 = DSM 21215]
MILHAQLSPGGGFQGGVIISSALLLIYLAGTYTKFMKQLSLRMMEMIETLGLIGFMTLGSIPLFHQKPFLTNFLPKGMLGNILSAGILMPLNILVGITVTAAIIQILHEFMEQLIITKRHNTRKKNS